MTPQQILSISTAAERPSYLLHFIFLIISFLFTDSNSHKNPLTPTIPTAITSGNTFYITTDDGTATFRLIGVNAPYPDESSKEDQRASIESRSYLKRLIEGESIYLMYDEQIYDHHGRDLVYVTRARDLLDINAEMIRAGYATAITQPPNDKMSLVYTEIEKEAKKEGRGLFAKTTSSTSPSGF